MLCGRFSYVASSRFSREAGNNSQAGRHITQRFTAFSKTPSTLCLYAKALSPYLRLRLRLRRLLRLSPSSPLQPPGDCRVNSVVDRDQASVVVFAQFTKADRLRATKMTSKIFHDHQFETSGCYEV